MPRVVSLYGFGSFFVGKHKARDIDLLIVHDSTDKSSCIFAIECKRHLLKAIKKLHITMLSKKEEKDFNFIEIAKAKKLGVISRETIEQDIMQILKSNFRENFDT